MAKHNELGKIGENRAVQYLLGKGFQIRERNWRFGKEEIDIIAESDTHLAIVEVKTRSNNLFGEPQEFISSNKRRHLIRAANFYAEKNSIEKDIYFDVIAITLSPTEKIEHIEQAFYP